MQAENLSWQRDFMDVSLQVRAGEVPGHLRFHGLRRAWNWRARCSEDQAVRDCDAGRRNDPPEEHRDAKRAGIAFVPESRRSMLFHHEPIYKNTSISILERISRLWLKPRREREIARSHVDRLHIRTPGVDALLGNLSGGNQQKVALSKWLTYEPKVLILSEPTRGMDVGRQGGRGEDRARPARPGDRHHRGVDRAGNRCCRWRTASW
jgi:ribose transport system ATP-binding protein